MKVNVRQTSKDICNLFEDLLDKHNIKIPDEDRQGEESEAPIYGITYAELEEQVTDVLTNILNETKRKDLDLETDTYNFNKQDNGVYYLDESKTQKYAIQIQETLTRIVILDADNYEDAEYQVSKAYHDTDIELNADNSNVEVEYSDITDRFIELVGESIFKKLPETEEITKRKLK